jgi:tRNA-dihydrouridine synthase 4
VDFVNTVQSAGVDFLTIHGRTRAQASSIPVSLEAITLVASHCTVPVIANGDISSLSVAHSFSSETNVDGVMAARSLLCNPSLFSGATGCTWEAVWVFFGKVVRTELPFKCVMHHLTEMTGPDGVGAGDGGGGKALLSKRERAEMIDCKDMIELLDYLDDFRDRGRF